MCLVTKDSTIRIVQKNIIVYKALEFSGKSPYLSFYYLPFKKYIVKDPLELIRGENIILVEEGFHSFVNKYDAKSFAHRNYCKVNTFIIPKGASYVVGQWDGLNGPTNLVSDQIIRIGRGPFAWIWKLIYKSYDFLDYSETNH